MSENILSIRNLEKIYPNGIRALKNLSFDVKPGEFLVVIGLSGSGKSTLLRCINRLIEPTSGEIIFHDQKTKQSQNIAKATRHEIRNIRHRVAMIFQSFNLIERHSVLQNVLYGALGYTGAFRSIFGLFEIDVKKRAMDQLKLVGVAEKAYFRASQLSGGQKQRVAIARALLQSPQILLADEPVASLDPASCHVVMNHLRRVNRELGLTVICNLHFLSLVREYATRVIALKDGELVYDGIPSEINNEWFKKIYGTDAQEVHIE